MTAALWGGSDPTYPPALDEAVEIGHGKGAGKTKNGPGQVNKLTQFAIEKRVRIGMYGPSIGIQTALQFTP